MLSAQVSIDTSQFDNTLGSLKNKMKYIARRMMNRVSAEIKKEIRNTKLKGQVLKRKTGGLARSLKYKSFPNFTGIFESTKFYATFHELGPVTIMPRKSSRKYLRFQVDGEWKTIRQVTLPRRQFILPVIQDYFNTGKAEQLMTAVLQDEINKLGGGDR